MHAPPGRDHIVVPRARDVVAMSLCLATPRAWWLSIAQNSIGRAVTSGPARELAGLRMDLDLLAFLDEKRNANLEARLERGEFGHVAAGRVTPRTRLCAGDDQFDMGGN